MAASQSSGSTFLNSRGHLRQNLRLGRGLNPMRKLPRRVYEKHGSYWFVDRQRVWYKLSRVSDGEAKMYLALAARLETHSLTSVPAAIGAFKNEYLPTLAACTRKEHARLLDIAANEFEKFEVGDVQPSDIARSVKNLYANRPTAARHYKARLSTFFRWTVTQGLRNDNPCREVWLKAPPKRDRYISDDELLDIRTALLLGDDMKPTPSGEMVRCFVDLCYLTAQRPTDVRRLLLTQIRDDAIAFRPSKTAHSSGARVLVPLTPSIREVLERAKACGASYHEGSKRSGNVKSIYVIHSLDGNAYTMSGLRSAWVRAVSRARKKYVENCEHEGIAPSDTYLVGVTIKDLRPKALTDAERAGYTIEELKTAAAHASVTTTEGYVKTYREPVSKVRLSLPSRKS